MWATALGEWLAKPHRLAGAARRQEPQYLPCELDQTNVYSGGERYGVAVIATRQPNGLGRPAHGAQNGAGDLVS